ncbi:hypothetical protein ACFC09_15435 [Streptomyces sp. NPDC056161]|uniref:hypothetical protein n=1 Tax=Streptomyces sp. NPDC056161 TaxID=3345732 RepID=UPI0035DF37EF
MTTIRIRNTEDAVSGIAALATKVIAAGGHEGHDLETVGTRMTSDEVLDAIRRSFSANIRRGLNTREAFTATGQSLIAHYCNAANIPTREV